MPRIKKNTNKPLKESPYKYSKKSSYKCSKISLEEYISNSSESDNIKYINSSSNHFNGFAYDLNIDDEVNSLNCLPHKLRVLDNKIQQLHKDRSLIISQLTQIDKEILLTDSLIFDYEDQLYIQKFKKFINKEINGYIIDRYNNSSIVQLDQYFTDLNNVNDIIVKDSNNILYNFKVNYYRIQISNDHYDLIFD